MSHALCRLLPQESTWHVLVNEALVVRLERGNVWLRVGFGVEVKLVELAHPLEHSPVLVRAEVVVGVGCVPRVERVIADHVEALLGQRRLVVLEHLWKEEMISVRETSLRGDG